MSSKTLCTSSYTSVVRWVYTAGGCLMGHEAISYGIYRTIVETCHSVIATITLSGRAVITDPLIDWISDTRSQGYTDLQSLVKCLDHRDVVYSMQSSKGCVRLRDALKCSRMHLGGYIYSHVEMLKSKAAEKQTEQSKFQT